MARIEYPEKTILGYLDAGGKFIEAGGSDGAIKFHLNSSSLLINPHIQWLLGDILTGQAVADTAEVQSVWADVTSIDWNHLSLWINATAGTGADFNLTLYGSVDGTDATEVAFGVVLGSIGITALSYSFWPELLDGSIAWFPYVKIGLQKATAGTNDYQIALMGRP